MSQGISTELAGPTRPPVTGSRRHRGRALPRQLIALSLIALLAACAQKQQQAVVDPYAAGEYNRPDSYAPPGPPSDPWGPWIRQASRRFDVPERWIREVMRQESAGRTTATSPVGAMGLMQVMPGTYRELRRRYGFGNDPYHPYDSIMAGAAYIREMYDLYGSPGFLAAYNAGPRRLEDYLWNGRGLPNETRNYVAKIGPHIVAHHPRHKVAPEIAAAGEIPLYIPAGPRRMDSGTMLALREQRQASEPNIQVATLAPGTVIRMEPIPDGSTYATAAPPLPTPAPRVQVASLDGLPGNTVIRMEPIPDGSTPQGAAALAHSGRRSGEGRANNDTAAYDPQPSETRALAAAVAAAAATSSLTPPQPAPSLQAEAAAAVPSALAAPAVAEPTASERAEPEGSAPGRAAPERGATQRRAPERVTTAALPVPPHAAPAPAWARAAERPVERPVERPMALAAALPVPPPVPPRLPQAPTQLAMAQPAPRGGLGLMGSANAASLPPHLRTPITAAPAQWGVQVGAFTSEAQARAAAASAQSAAGNGSKVVVTPVQQGKATLYRARVLGLSQPSAQQACDRLRQKGACSVVSPDTRS